jgi:hypothetical protein
MRRRPGPKRGPSLDSDQGYQSCACHTAAHAEYLVSCPMRTNEGNVPANCWLDLVVVGRARPGFEPEKEEP